MNTRAKPAQFAEALGVLAVWLLASWPFLDPGTNVYGFDTLAYTGPNIRQTFDAWKTFDLPLWHEGIFGGVPFLGRLNSQALYIPHLPFSFMDVSDALDLLAPLHLLILVIGMYLFVRIGHNLAAPAGFVASAIVAASAYTSVKMLSYEQLVAIAWIPWIFLFIEISLRHPTRRSAFGPFGVVLTLFLLGSHPQTVFIAAFAVVGYLVVRIVDTRAYKSLITMALAGVTAIAASATQFVGAYLLGKSSGIGGKRSLDLLNQAAYVLPTNNLRLALLGDPFSSSPASVSVSGEAILGIGAVAVALALAGLVIGQRVSLRLRVALIVGCAIAVLFAAGPNQIVFRIAYRLIPGFGVARVAGRWLVIPMFFIALLAAIGMDAMTRDAVTRYRAALMAGLSALVAGLILIPHVVTPSSHLRWWWLSAIVVVAAATIARMRPAMRVIVVVPILLLLVVEVISPLRNTPPTKQRFEQGIEDIASPILERLEGKPGLVYAQTFDRFDSYPYLISTLRPNTNSLYGLRSLDGYDGGQWVQKRWITAVSSLTHRPFNTDLTIRSQVRGPLEAKQFARFGVRWVLLETEVVPAEVQLFGWRGPVEKMGTLELWENPEWMAPGVLYFDSQLRQKSSARQLRVSSPDSVIVENPELVLACGEALGVCERRAATLLAQEKSGGSFSVEIDRTAVLAIDQSWSRDWVVRVDGQPREAIPVNVNQLGVVVPAGKHVIDYDYAPEWVSPSFTLSILGALVLLVATSIWLRSLMANAGREKIWHEPNESFLNSDGK